MPHTITVTHREGWDHTRQETVYFWGSDHPGAVHVKLKRCGHFCHSGWTDLCCECDKGEYAGRYICAVCEPRPFDEWGVVLYLGPRH